MPWSMDDWQYLERQVVADPKGRQWSVGLMDVLGQAGDPDRPNEMLELEYASGRYFNEAILASTIFASLHLCRSSQLA